ncbi:MAG: S8 family serine peptidase [Ginsengibacter sp.]
MKSKSSQTIIVAVIDNGVDIEHEDLKNVIWTNKREIRDNGIDDDHNGYIDDVHGWNFRGSKQVQLKYTWHGKTGLKMLTPIC